MRRCVPLLWLGLTACASAPDRSTVWDSEVGLTVPGVHLSGCAVGDIDPRHFGNEVAVTAGNGLVYVLRAEEDAWFHEVVAALPGEPIQCAVGDVLPQREGLELVTVGMESGDEDTGSGGVAVMVSRESGGWKETVLCRDEAFLHAVAIGDVDPTRPGPEVAVAGGSGRVLLVTRGDEGWQREVVATLPGAAKGMRMGLGGLVVACDDGSLVRLRRRSSGWETDLLARADEALARVDATADMVSWCANDGRLRLLRDDWEEVVLRASDRLRGAVLADLDPSRPGLEGATAGYDGLVRVVHGGPMAWARAADHRGVAHLFEVTVVAADDDRLHHLAAGDLPGRGTCLVACGYSGRVTVVRWVGQRSEDAP